MQPNIESANLPELRRDFSNSEYHQPRRGDRKEYWKSREKTRNRSRTKDTSHYRMIAWDGEGMKLTGEKFPQHYVLFGCSADTENPLVITDPSQRLKFTDIVDYALRIKAEYP